MLCRVGEGGGVTGGAQKDKEDLIFTSYKSMNFLQKAHSFVFKNIVETMTFNIFLVMQMKTFFGGIRKALVALFILN